MLGVDLGSYSLKYCLTRKKKEDTFEIVKTGDFILPAEAFAGGEVRKRGELTEELKEYWKKERLPREVCLSFYHPQIVVQNITIPEMSEAEMENALRWEAGSIITGEDQFQVGWEILNRQDGNVEILFSASPSVAVSGYLELFQDAGIRIEAVEPHIICLLKGFLGLHPDLGKQGGFVLVEVGYLKSSILYFEKGRLAFSRYLTWGLSRVWDHLRDRGNLLPAEIMELIQRGTRFTDVPHQLEEALSETIPDLHAEIKRSFTYFQTTFGAEALANSYLLGGGSRILLLRSGLESSLSITFRDLKTKITDGGEQFHFELYLAAMGASLWS